MGQIYDTRLADSLQNHSGHKKKFFSESLQRRKFLRYRAEFGFIVFAKDWIFP